ncbi:serine/threonine-protein phosphatase 2A regulatory subunit B'' subunit beta [Elysia marginata]|uniref:Serine/threonine-protein phosphatase 2A regulatory subunit B'' subunit beta n=1 Tax=Elysia marginata TaxID=1093978 RepID=A0AAV4GRJ7_9GAST|nr:serine/threonine-protein phosphatase 2A regulatory subunit B'' subunit beta [Elysia marginata]
MALKPVLKVKVDELFLRWLSDPDVQLSLRESLSQIGRGEIVTAPTGPVPGTQQNQQGRHSSLLSRGGAGASSIVSPVSPKLPSPRSPRRPLHTRKHNNNSGGIQGQINGSATEAGTTSKKRTLMLPASSTGMSSELKCDGD